jgi:hypothetical protein
MRCLTIEASSAAWALGFASALSEFDILVIETDDGMYLVRVTISGGHGQAVHVLDALEAYVSLNAAEAA